MPRRVVRSPNNSDGGSMSDVTSLSSTNPSRTEIIEWLRNIARHMRKGTRPDDARDRTGFPGRWLCPNIVATKYRATWRNAAGETRHAGVCTGDACDNWSGYCRVGAAVAVAGPLRRPHITERDTGEMCPVRERCRWRAENGPRACSGCPDLSWGSPADSYVPLLRTAVLTETKPLS